MLRYIDALSNTKRTLIIGSLLLAGVASLGIKVARIHSNGVPVVLATVPVDPRSLFQGDYVVLNYEISTLDNTLREANASPRENADVYLELQPGTPVWTPVRFSNYPLHAAAGNVVIRGTQEKHWSDKRTRVRYGIESFLVPEGQGLPVERLRNASERVTVRVLVAPDGAALPQNVLVDGQPIFSDSGM